MPATLGTVYGHRVELIGPCRIVDGHVTFETKLTRLWWAPLPMAWKAAGMLDPWWVRPLLFVWALWTLARDRGVE